VSIYRRQGIYTVLIIALAILAGRSTGPALLSQGGGIVFGNVKTVVQFDMEVA